MSEKAWLEEQGPVLGPVVPVIRTRYHGVVVLEVNHEHGRYLWFSTSPDFRVILNSGRGSHGWVTSCGQGLNVGMYVDFLPGSNPHGRKQPLSSWDFAFDLYESLCEEFGCGREQQCLEFTVLLNVIRSTGATTVSLTSSIRWIDHALQRHFGLSNNSYGGVGIPGRRQNPRLISKIRRFLRDVWGAYHIYVNTQERVAEVLTRFRSRGIPLVPIRTIEVHPGLFIDEYGDGSLWVRGTTDSGREVDQAHTGFIEDPDNLARAIKGGRYARYR